MKQIDLIEELEKANQETVTIDKADLETLIDALNSSYKVFEKYEEVVLGDIKDDFMCSSNAENQKHGGVMLANIGAWNMGLSALVKIQDLLNSNKSKTQKAKKEVDKSVEPDLKKVAAAREPNIGKLEESYFTNCFGEKMKKQN